MYGMGAAVGDYDNDGSPDLYVTGYPRNYLFHNRGNGRFEELAEKAGVRDSGWSTSAAWLDYDKDGQLDLFVCHYVPWTPATDVFRRIDAKSKAYRPPNYYPGQVNRLYHGSGGKFTDVSRQAGILSRTAKGKVAGEKLEVKALGVATCDYNNDGWPDILVANDTERNFVFENRQNGTFDEVAVEAGMAFNRAGRPRAGMGIDTADIDH